jgi:hypothetical protein
VLKLSSLFALDAFAGGFVVMTFMVFWFERTFGASAQLMSVVVFAGGLLQAGSSIVAAPVGARFGLLNTVVFSPCRRTCCSRSYPSCPTLELAIVVLPSVALSQMDVPSADRPTSPPGRCQGGRRQPRSPTRRGTWPGPLTPYRQTALMQNVAVGAPFVVAGGVKCLYDLLWRTFGGCRSPEPTSELFSSSIWMITGARATTVAPLERASPTP